MDALERTLAAIQDGESVRWSDAPEPEGAK